MSFSSSLGAVASGAGTYAAAEQSAESINRTLDNLLNEGEALFNADKKKKKKKLDKGVKHLVGPKTYVRPSLLDQAAFASGIHHAVTGAYTKGYLKAAFSALPELITKDKGHVLYGKQPKLGGKNIFDVIQTPKFDEVKKILNSNLTFVPKINTSFDTEGKLERLKDEVLEDMMDNHMGVTVSDNIKKDILGDKIPDHPLLAKKLFAITPDEVYRAPYGLPEQLASAMSDTNADHDELRKAFESSHFEGFDSSVVDLVTNPEKDGRDAYDIMARFNGTLIQGEDPKYNKRKTLKPFRDYIRRFGADLESDTAPDVKEYYKDNPDKLRDKIIKKKSITAGEIDQTMKDEMLRLLQKKANEKHEKRRGIAKSYKFRLKGLSELADNLLVHPDTLEDAIKDLDSSELHLVMWALKNKGADEPMINEVKKREEYTKGYESAVNKLAKKDVDILRINVIKNDFRKHMRPPQEFLDKLERDIHLLVDTNVAEFERQLKSAHDQDKKEELLIEFQYKMPIEVVRHFDEQLKLEAEPAEESEESEDEKPEAPELVAEQLITEEPTEALDIKQLIAGEGEINIEEPQAKPADVEDEGNDFFHERPETETL